MMLDLKFFDQYYVGFQNERYNHSDEQGRILGFATYITNDKAYEKRKQTVDHWASKDIDTILMANVPMAGFKIVDAVSRSYNDNKLFRVEDPRGFELEIDVFNLFRIISDHTIVKGVIVEEMLWARQGTSNYLIAKSSPEYQQHLNGTFSNEHVPGNYYMNKVGNIAYRFEGKFHYAEVVIEKERVDSHRRNGWGYYDKEPFDATKISTNLRVKVDARYKEKMFVYTEYNLKNGEIDPDALPIVHFKKSKPKDLLATDKKFVSDFVFPIETYVPGYISTWDNKGAKFAVNSPSRYGNSYYIFFKSLERAREEEFNCHIIEKRTGFKKALEEANAKRQYDYHATGIITYLGLTFKT